MQVRWYPSLVDIYRPTIGQDEDSGEVQRTYGEPVTVRCGFEPIDPESNREKFGKVYSDNELLRVEISPKDAEGVDLSCRVSNLRQKGKESVKYYEGQTFNVTGLNPLVDFKGKVIAVELYCELEG